MDEEYYFIIVQTEDGLKIERLDKSQINQIIQETPEYNYLKDFPRCQWSKSEFIIDSDSPLNGMSNECIIIKGKIVQPKIITKITKLILE